MQDAGLSLNPNKVISLLKECASSRSLDWAAQLHAAIVEHGLEANALVQSTLVRTYLKCGSVRNSRWVFYSPHCNHDHAAWTAMIAGYAQHKLSNEALCLFEQMQTEGETPNHFTIASILKACADKTNLKLGQQIHAGLVGTALHSDVFVTNTLIDMYAKCRKMEHARMVFDGMCKRDVVSWSAMISGYIQLEHWTEALNLFEEMQQKGLHPNNYTHVSVLKACASLKDANRGRHIHGQVFERALDNDVFVASILLDMYVKCGTIEDAQWVFFRMDEPDLVLWNAMISGYAEHGLGKEAVSLFMKMQHAAVGPDKVTFASTLKACAFLASLHLGKHVHARIANGELEADLFTGNTIIDMYVKCGSIKDAHEVFDSMCERDVVSWNSLLAGYAQVGPGDDVLGLFYQLQLEGIIADIVSYLAVVKACATLAALNLGQRFHAHLIHSSIKLNLTVHSALVDMYAKCGSIEDARQIFNALKERDVVAWNAIIASYAQQGLSKDVFTLFESMQEEGIKPTGVTLSCILSACSHGGLVEEGCRYFKCFTNEHSLKPSTEHYGCIVDIFGRVGTLHEAIVFLNDLPDTLGVEPWMSLLGACKTHVNLEVGEQAFEHVKRLEPENVGATVLLSNLYAAAGRWDAVATTRQK